MCVCVCVCLSVCLSGSVCPSICLSFFLCVRPSLSGWLPARISVWLSVRPYLCLADCLSVSLSVWLSVCLPVRISVWLAVRPSVRISVCLSASPYFCQTDYLPKFGWPALCLYVYVILRPSVHLLTTTYLQLSTYNCEFCYPNTQKHTDKNKVIMNTIAGNHDYKLVHLHNTDGSTLQQITVLNI